MKFLALFFTLFTLSLADIVFKPYFFLSPTYTNRTLDYEVKMTKDAILTNKENNQKINAQKGETHKFSLKTTSPNLSLGIGTKKGIRDNFYELGARFAKDFSEVFAKGGFTFEYFEERYFLPYLALTAGLSFDGNTKFSPSNYFYSPSLGFISQLSSVIDTRLEFGYLRRHWQDISHPYGDEKWQDSELNLSLSLIVYY